MKTVIRTIAAASALSALAFFVQADERGDMCQAITESMQSSHGNVCVVVNEDQVILSGYVDSQVEKDAAERAAAEMAGEKEVVSLITVSD